MSMIQSDLLLGQEGGAGYTISRSLRFNSSDSAYLSRNFSSSATDLKRQTFSFWAKRAFSSSGNNWVFTGYNGSATYETQISFSADYFRFGFGGSFPYQCTANGFFRDPSAWYHFLVSVDTTQATDTNRVKLYVNGVQQTLLAATYPTQNATSQFGLNSGTQCIGSDQNISNFFSGYLADIHFIDGQALTPSSFTEVSATTGQLIPKAYTGTFTGNSFWLKFADNSAATATTLGKDSSGLGNNWTPNNLSVTAGAGNDSLVDTPTSAGTDTGLGGQVTGNYATLNPLIGVDNRTLSNGNLDYAVGGSNTFRVATTTIAVSSGKYYVEVSNFAGGAFGMLGIVAGDLSSQELNQDRIQDKANVQAKGYVLFEPHNDYYRIDGGSSVSYTIGTPSGSDVLGFALNMDAKTCQLYKNGIALGSVSFSSSALANKAVYFVTNEYSGRSGSFNAGQRPFAYTAPSGFKALCDTSLPAPVVAKPSTVMDVKLYTGNGTSQTISGLGFSPDFVWLKSRGAAYNHQLFDTIRGTGKQLFSNLTSAETTESFSWLNAFNSNGFGVTGAAGVNDTNDPMVAWCFDAGSSTSTNTAGSITSQVRANASAGFSIVTVESIPVNDVVIGHGLGVAPQFIFGKNRDDSLNRWMVYHHKLTPDTALFLNLTNGETGDYSYSQGIGAAPTSTTFPIRRNNWGASGGQRLVFYCFAPVNSYSAFGSYQGNGSADGPFVFCNFRPRWLLIKRTDTSGDPWIIRDAARDPYNSTTSAKLAPNESYEENNASYIGAATATLADFVSNGFKVRSTGNISNASGGTYVWAAFAESPFAYSRAR